MGDERGERGLLRALLRGGSLRSPPLPRSRSRPSSEERRSAIQAEESLAIKLGTTLTMRVSANT